MTPDNMLRGKGCVYCAQEKLKNNKIKTHEHWISRIKEVAGEEYDLLETAYYGKRKHLFRHNECGHEFEMSLEKFINGNRCPKCSKSHGERHIARWLDDHGITYSQEVRFSDCRNKQPLPFDFMVFRKDGSYFLIEYDGRQHFQDNDKTHFEEYEVRKYKDDIKTKYCGNKGITLYRIPYTLYDRPGQGNHRINARLQEICDNC